MAFLSECIEKYPHALAAGSAAHLPDDAVYHSVQFRFGRSARRAGRGRRGAAAVPGSKKRTALYPRESATGWDWGACVEWARGVRAAAGWPPLEGEEARLENLALECARLLQEALSRGHSWVEVERAQAGLSKPDRKAVVARLEAAGTAVKLALRGSGKKVLAPHALALALAQVEAWAAPPDEPDEYFWDVSDRHPFEAATTGLVEEQLRALRGMSSASGPRLQLLVGGPGTGKSSVLEAWARHPELGATTLALALTNQQRLALRARGFRNCTTLAGALLWAIDPENHACPLDAGLPPIRTVIIEECSMVSADLLAACFSALGPRLPEWSRLLLVGDPDQLPPVGTGFPLRSLSRRPAPFAVHWLTHCHRVRRSARALVSATRTLLATGDWDQCLERGEGTVRMVPTTSTSGPALARDLERLLGAERELLPPGETVVVTPYRYLLPFLNEACARAWYGFGGGGDAASAASGGPPVARGGLYSPKDTLSTHLRQGTSWTVVSVRAVDPDGPWGAPDAEAEGGAPDDAWEVELEPSGQQAALATSTVRVRLMRDPGPFPEVPLDSFRPYMCGTNHEMQGREAAAVVFVLPPGAWPTVAHMYTALTRAQRFAAVLGSPDIVRSVAARPAQDPADVFD